MDELDSIQKALNDFFRKRAVITPSKRSELERVFALDTRVLLQMTVNSYLNDEVHVRYTLKRNNTDSKVTKDTVQAMLALALNTDEEDVELSEIGSENRKYMGRLDIPVETIVPNAKTISVEFSLSGNSQSLLIPQWVIEADDYSIEDYVRRWWSSLPEDKMVSYIWPGEAAGFYTIVKNSEEES